MATRTKQGFHVPVSDFQVDGVTPDGVYIMDGKVKVWLHYTGTEDGARHKFVLPGDPAFLRDFAGALSQVATDIEAWRNPRPGQR